MWEQMCILLSFLQYCLSVDLVYHAEEESNPRTFVGDIAFDLKMLDRILPGDARLIKFIQLQRRMTKMFNVTNNGKIFTTQKLDAESLCVQNSVCSQIIKVAIHQAKTFIKILKIKIIIEDINDHQPEFPVKQVHIQFSERDSKGSKISIPNAIDKDVGFINSQIKYQLIKKANVPFALTVYKRADGRSTLEIVLEETLDREEHANYLLKVVAKDEAVLAQESSLYVNVSVTDVNDNQPVFIQNIYNISIEKTHDKGKPVIHLSAKDIDADENGHVSYYFSPMTSSSVKDKFTIREATGQIFLSNSSHFNDNLKYKLYIEARDNGNPPKISVATVLVNVINQHNNPPNIDIDFVSPLNHNTATILEDIKVGSFIAYVMVTDNDVGHNGEVSCDIKHDTFKLQSMGSKEYKIVLKKAVDRETQEHYHFTVSCQDKGLPPLKIDQDLSIQVLDVNDVQPHFTKSMFQFLTYENEEQNFPVGFISATDPDEGDGGQLSYSIINPRNEDPLPFRILNYGFILTCNTLDREQQKSYQFSVFVKDNGTPSLNNSAKVVVEILDQNDNAPYFTFPSIDPYTLNVHYHQQSKSDITVLRASDGDSGNNAFLKYSILKGNDKQLFTVNIYTGTFSFSRTAYQNDAGSYQLEFVVKDSGTPVLSATTSVSLTLTVSNKTSSKLTTKQIESNDTINVTSLIIIVASAVIVSIVIVVSITLCIVRCNNVRNNSARTTEEKQAYQCRNEMRQLIYQGKSPVVISRNPDEIINRNTQSVRSMSEYFSESEPQDKWLASTTVKYLPKDKRPITETFCDGYIDQNHDKILNYQPRKENGLAWMKTECRDYEEITGIQVYKEPPPRFKKQK